MEEIILVFLCIAQIIVGANVITRALTNSKLTRLVEKISMSHHSMQNN